MLYENPYTPYMSIILNSKVKECPQHRIWCKLSFFFFFVWQYVTYVTIFRIVYTYLNSIYYTSYVFFLYHFKKASEYYQEIPQLHTADQPTAS